MATIASASDDGKGVVERSGERETRHDENETLNDVSTEQHDGQCCRPLLHIGQHERPSFASQTPVTAAEKVNMVRLVVVIPKKSWVKSISSSAQPARIVNTAMMTMARRRS